MAFVPVGDKSRKVPKPLRNRARALSVSLKEPNKLVQEARKRFPRAYEPWSEEEDELLRELVRLDTEPSLISVELGRNEGAVRSRIDKLEKGDAFGRRKAVRSPSKGKRTRRDLGKGASAKPAEGALQLDSKQEFVSELGDGVYSIIAGPGSGKSRTLVARVLRLIESGVSPKEIALISHTRGAGQELKDRLKSAGYGRLGHTGTFHSLAGKLARKLGIATSRTENYDGLLPDVTKALKRAGHTKQFRHVLVDEFQDTSDLQLEFLDEVAREASSLLVVGDPNQAIFGWAGVSRKVFDDFASLFPRCKRHYLTVSYRCPAPILQFADGFMNHRVVLTSLRATGAVDSKYFQELELEADFMASEIEGWCGSAAESAVLVRYGYQVDILRRVLPADWEVLTIHKAKGREWKSVAVIYDDRYATDRGEEDCVKFVAATRASENLVFYEAL